VSKSAPPGQTTGDQVQHSFPVLVGDLASPAAECGHRSLTFVERLTAAESEVRRVDILVAELIHVVRSKDRWHAEMRDAASLIREGMSTTPPKRPTTTFGQPASRER